MCLLDVTTNLPVLPKIISLSLLTQTIQEADGSTARQELERAEWLETSTHLARLCFPKTGTNGGMVTTESK
jgi:hypothetical protein